MAHRITGIANAKEISLTKRGANQFATKVVLKSFDSRQVPSTELAPLNQEPTDMDVAKIAKAMACMDEITKGYVAHMPDQKVSDFLTNLNPEQQKAEAKKAFDDAEAIEVAKRASEEGKTVREVELEKRLGAQDTIVAELTKRLDTEKAERELEKAAASPDYNGFPGGAEKLVEVLKTAAALPTEQGDLIREMAKAQAKSNIMLSRERGLHLLPVDELAKTMPATVELEKRAVERAAADKTTVMIAKGRIIREDGALAERAQAEQAA